MLIVKQMKCEVQSKCQNDCEMCAHGGLRKTLPDYNLSLDDLNHFLDITKQSNYYIENMRIHGPGEPLLWKDFNEGVKLMKTSGVIGTIFVATNGHLLHKIQDETWEYINDIRVSVYQNFLNEKLLNHLVSKYPKKIVINRVSDFLNLPQTTDEAPIPCQCNCPGPMLLGNKLFLFCGPPVFDAIKSYRKNPLSENSLFVDIEKDYLKNFDESKIGNLDFCKKCWANRNFHLTKKSHNPKIGFGV